MRITVTPEQQIDRLREMLEDCVGGLEYRGVPARDVLEIVWRAIALHDLEQRHARGEVEPRDCHLCDFACPSPCPEFDD